MDVDDDATERDLEQGNNVSDDGDGDRSNSFFCADAPETAYTGGSDLRLPTSYTSKYPRFGPSRPKPMAVLEVMNKQGGGVFDEPEHKALVRLCTAVETLLRRKAAEVALLKSGMMERSCSRSGHAGDTASSNYARVESTIMRLYSETIPADIMFGEQQRELLNAAGGRGSRNVIHRDVTKRGGRSRGNGLLSEDRSSGGGGNISGSCGTGERDSEDNQIGGGRDRDGEGAGGSGASLTFSHAGGLTLGDKRGEPPDTSLTSLQTESELTDWSMNMFERSAEQQLSLVERFYRSMGLMERFQVVDFFAYSRQCICKPLQSKSPLRD